MPTRFEQRFKETPVTLYAPVPPEKLTPAEAPTLEAPITPEAAVETTPIETMLPEETTKRRRKRRAGVSLNNLPEEIVQMRLKWFTLYTVALLMLSFIGTAALLNPAWVQTQIRNITNNTEPLPTKPTPNLTRLMQDWQFPKSKIAMGSNNMGMGDMRTYNLTSPNSFQEIYTFYAQKCGYTSKYQEVNEALTTGTPKGSCSILKTITPNGKNAQFIFTGDGYAMNVLVDSGPSNKEARIVLSGNLIRTAEPTTR